jgi:ABC-type branched-subunit amino acid transport system substrate-binding protein
MSIQSSWAAFIGRAKTIVAGLREAVKKRRWLGSLVALLGAAIVGALVALPIQDVWNARRGQPFVAVILSNSNPNFTIPMELRQGIQYAMAGPPTIPTPNQESVEIKFVLSSLTAEDTARDVRERCIDDPDCIAIVGASDSTTTTATLEEILRTPPHQRPALIMPIATATSLTERAAIGDFPQILRLVPNNDDQAQQIKSFIASRAPTQRVTVIVDRNNPEYSVNLADIIVQAIRENGGDATRIEHEGSQTLAQANRLELPEQDFIVFVGTSSNGLEIIQDMKRYGIRVPIIFTDGNTVQEVIDQSIGMPGPAYFLTPVAQLNDVSEPGYTAIGRDTYAILASIFSQSRQLTRRAVAEFVAQNKHEISLEPGAAGRYRFGQDGENSVMHFKIFRIVDGQVHIETGY